MSYYYKVGKAKTKYQADCESISRDVLERHWESIGVGQGKGLLSLFEESLYFYPDDKKIQWCNEELTKWLNDLNELPISFIEQLKIQTLGYIKQEIDNLRSVDGELIRDNLVHALMLNVDWDLRLNPEIDRIKFEEYVHSDSIPEKKLYDVREAYLCFLMISEIMTIREKLHWTYENRKVFNEKHIEFLVYGLTKASSINLTKFPEDTQKLIAYLKQEDLSKAKSSISVGCTNRALWYIMYRLKILDPKFNPAVFLKSEFLKSRGGKPISRRNWDGSKDENPVNKSKIDQIFSRVLKEKH